MAGYGMPMKQKEMMKRKGMTPMMGSTSKPKPKKKPKKKGGGY